MSTHRKLLTVCCAAVFALGLAACGSSDDDSTADAPAVEEPTGPTQAELDAAQAAADAAQAAADAAEQALADKEAADAAAATTLMGQQLHRAMGAAPLANLGTRPDDDGTADVNERRHLVSLSPTGVTVWFPGFEGDGTTPTATASPLMKASGDALDAQNGWEGQHYAHSRAGVSNEARVYSFKGDTTGTPAAEAFAGASFTGRNEIASADSYNAADRSLAFDDGSTSKLFKSDSFPDAGKTDYEVDDTGTIAFEGTYDGVPGTYRCTGATCTATVPTGGGIMLTAGTWTFVHESGASTSVPDSAYQYFGWWLQKVHGVPTGASAFFGTAGAGGQAAGDLTAISGSAKYSGSAAGKWAHDDTLAETGSAGHFTADATLTAKFGVVTAAGNESGVTGSLTNFMANEEAVDWKVTLTRAGWTPTDGAFTNAGEFGGGRTVWSIDGKGSDPSGSWNGQMYDDAAADNRDVPTAAAGVFNSDYAGTYRMVGGFGVRKD